MFLPGEGKSMGWNLQSEGKKPYERGKGDCKMQDLEPVDNLETKSVSL